MIRSCRAITTCVLILHFVFITQTSKPSSSGLNDVAGKNNIINLTKTNQDPCQNNGKCGVNIKVDIPNCYCDPACQEYSDCCFDIPTIPYNNTAAHSVQDKFALQTCRVDLLPQINGNTFGYYVISACPSSYLLKEIINKCESGENNIPVSGSDDFTYSNMYCSICHNVSSYEEWTIQFISYMDGKCSPESTLSTNEANIVKILQRIKRHGCDFTFIPPKQRRPRICRLNVIENSKCKEYNNPIHVSFPEKNRVLYKNYFCIPNVTDDLKFRCAEPTYKNKKFLNGNDMGVLFKLRPTSELTEETNCYQRNTVFNQPVGVCGGKDCYEDSCYLSLIRNFKIDVNLRFLLAENIENEFLLRAALFWFLSLPVERFGIHIDTIYQEQLCSFDSLNRPCCIASNALKMIVQSENTMSTLLALSSRIQQMIYSYSEENNGSITAIRNELKDTSNITVCLNKKLTNKRRVSTLHLKDVKSKIQFTDDRKNVPSNVEVYVKQSTLDENYPNITVIKWVLEYTKNNKTEAKFLKPSKWTLRAIITYVTMSTSCLFLFVTIIIYHILDLSISRSGRLSQHMLSSLLVAQLIFIFGAGTDNYKLLCLVVGVISHYSWLSAFVWISLFMVEICLMFRRIRLFPGTNNSDLNIPLYYLVLGYGIPLFIVGPSIVIEICQCTDINIGYAGEVCFPSGYPGNLIAFTIPVLCSLAINLVALVSASVSLSHYNSTFQTESFRASQSYISVYIKLCFYCAFPYAIGVVAEIVNVESLKFIYILLSGSQGLIVSVCFLARKAVLNKFRNKLSIPVTVMVGNTDT